MFLTHNRIPVRLDACRAFSDEKNGVSKVTHSTTIPCFRKISADNILSRPPEQRPKARTLFIDKFMIKENSKINTKSVSPVKNVLTVIISQSVANVKKNHTQKK